MVQKQSVKRIEKFINSWNEETIIDHLPFDKQFQIESIPLWWFYRRLIVRHVLPKQLNTYNSLYTEKPLTMAERGKLTFVSKILPRYFLQREYHKISWIHKHSTFHAEKIQRDSLDKNKEKSQKTILFLTYSNHISSENTLFRLEKVISELKSRKNIKELPLFVDPLSHNTYKEIRHQNTIYHYINADLNKEAEEKACYLNKKWREINHDMKKEIFLLEGKDLWSYLKYGLNFFFSKESIHLTYLYYLAFKRIITEENIKVVVVTGTGSLFEKCLFAAAKSLDVPIVAIAHGIGKEALNPDPIFPMKMAVFSNLYKEKLITAGMSEEDIIVVGPVIYDKIIPFRKQKEEKERNVVIATSPYIETGKVSKEEYFRRIFIVLEKINQVSGVNVAIKLHPRETHYQDYVNLIKERSLSPVTIHPPNLSREEFYSLINNADCFVHFGSNAALEAMIIDRPVVTLDLIGDIYPIDHWLYGIDTSTAALEVSIYGNIKEVILQAFEDNSTLKKNRAQIVDQCCGPIDGNSSRRVVDLISRLASDL